MELSTLLSPSRLVFDLHAVDKASAIAELSAALKADGILSDPAAFEAAVWKREQEYSTGIGMGIAIPHAKDASVKKASLVFGRSNAGADYQSMDGQPSHLFFLIAVPADANDTHLAVLSHLSRRLMHQNVRDRLMAANSYADILNAFAD